MAAKIYTNKDASLAPLKKKTLAVIGFGSQGHAHALNLKDSGLKVVIGLYKKSKSREVAKKLGFEVMDTADAVKAADVIFIATPDTAMKPTAAETENGMPRSSSASAPPTRASGTAANTRAACATEPSAK